MAQRKGSLYTFGFALGVCLVCSLILSLSATALKPRQVANARLDIVQNLLGAVGHDQKKLVAMPPEQVFELFEKEIQPLLLDQNNDQANTDFMRRELIEKIGYPAEEINELNTGDLLNRFESRKGLLARRNGLRLKEYDPGYKLLYIHKPGGDLNAYVVPVQGYGLWDIIKGYIALDTDLNTVKGISFYEHHETPGLGARIVEDWFRENFIGKKILDESGDLVSIKVAKGKVQETVKEDNWPHYVDGISGATLTGKGINQFLASDLARYEPYFKSLRSNL